MTCTAVDVLPIPSVDTGVHVYRPSSADVTDLITSVPSVLIWNQNNVILNVLSRRFYYQTFFKGIYVGQK